MVAADLSSGTPTRDSALPGPFLPMPISPQTLIPTDTARSPGVTSPGEESKPPSLPEPGTSPWHHLSADDTLARLESSNQNGLAEVEARRRIERFGPNALPEAKRRSPMLVFFRQFKSPLIYLLFVAAAVAFLLGERGDAVVILMVVSVNAIIG